MGWVKLVALTGMLSCLPSCADGGGDGSWDSPRDRTEVGDGRIQGDEAFHEPLPIVAAGYDSNAKWVVELFGHRITIPSRQVVYVIDRSGSMAPGSGGCFGSPMTGSRFDRAVDNVIQSISTLHEEARFNVITFACDIHSWSMETQLATEPNRLALESWLLGELPYGGTGTGMAVAHALEEREVLTVLLITDGQPNCGATGTAGHLAQILDANDQEAAIYTFGIEASGIFQQFLLDIASRTGGVYYPVGH